jgi:AraC-like DNA-binding protein
MVAVERPTVSEPSNLLWKFPLGARDEAWGLYLTAVGSGADFTAIAPSGWCLLFLVRGAAFLVVPGRRRIRVEAGETVLFDPATAALEVDPQRGCRIHHIQFAGELAARWLAPGLLGPVPRVIRTGFDETQLGLVARIVELARAKTPDTGRLLSGALAHLLARLEHASRLAGSSTPQLRLIQDASRLLADAGRDHTPLEAVSAELGISYSWLRRCFRQRTGLAPQRFRNLQRLDRACQILADTTLSIGAIAAQLGFSSQAYFARCFRQETGLSPSVWRTKQPKRTRP